MNWKIPNGSHRAQFLAVIISQVNNATLTLPFSCMIHLPLTAQSSLRFSLYTAPVLILDAVSLKHSKIPLLLIPPRHSNSFSLTVTLSPQGVLYVSQDFEAWLCSQRIASRVGDRDCQDCLTLHVVNHSSLVAYKPAEHRDTQLEEARAPRLVLKVPLQHSEICFWVPDFVSCYATDFHKTWAYPWISHAEALLKCWPLVCAVPPQIDLNI